MSNLDERDLWKRLFYQPYAIVMPWAVLVALLAIGWGGLNLVVLDRVRAERAQLERARSEARQQLTQRVEARQARKDMARVLAMLPEQRDFAPLALGLTEQAKVNRVRLPGLNYQVEKTDLRQVNKAVLQGSATGRYEDLRLFIHNLETAEELLLIENLEVDRARQREQTMTFNLRIVTYLRAAPGAPERS